MDLRSLRQFVAVARLGGITRAADALHIAQPALSRQIRQLEREVGVELLTRKPRGVELTKHGALLLERAEELIRLTERTLDELRSPADTAAERVSIGMPPASGLMIVPSFVRRMRAELPHVGLHLREGVANSLVEWVLNEVTDLALVHNPPAMPELDVQPLVTERMVVVLPPAEAEVAWEVPAGNAVRLMDLTTVPLILPSHPHTNRILLDSVMLRQGGTLVPTMEVDSVAMAKALVAEGFGATILTSVATAREANEGRVRTLPIEAPPVISKLALIQLKSRRSGALLQQVSAVVRRTVAALLEDGWLGAMASSQLLRARNVDG